MCARLSEVTQKEIQLQVKALKNILCNEELRLLAIETGFCSRESKLSPEVFFDLLFYTSSLSSNSSLEHLVSHLYDFHGIEFTEARYITMIYTRLILIVVNV